MAEIKDIVQTATAVGAAAGLGIWYLRSKRFYVRVRGMIVAERARAEWLIGQGLRYRGGWLPIWDEERCVKVCRRMMIGVVALFAGFMFFLIMLPNW